MRKKLKKIPRFKTEARERKFWQKADSTQYVDYSKTENWRFPNLKLTTRPITLRLPQTLIDSVKLKAHKMDVPYQTLMKQFIFAGMIK